MGIEVVREEATRMEQEHCCFCAVKTAWWSPKRDVAVCPSCAARKDECDVPSKAEWCRSPQAKGRSQ
jgi:hypothetical protein